MAGGQGAMELAVPIATGLRVFDAATGNVLRDHAIPHTLGYMFYELDNDSVLLAGHSLGRSREVSVFSRKTQSVDVCWHLPRDLLSVLLVVVPRTSVVRFFDQGSVFDFDLSTGNMLHSMPFADTLTHANTTFRWATAPDTNVAYRTTSLSTERELYAIL